MRSALLLGTLALALLAAPAGAAEHEVKMLNSIQNDGVVELMVFEPPFIKVEPGDTINFVPTDAAHNTASSYVPDSAETWNSPTGEPFSVTFQEEGIYLYNCQPHMALGMFGVVQVGKPVNLDTAKEQAKTIGATAAMNGDRLSKYLEQVQP